MNRIVYRLLGLLLLTVVAACGRDDAEPAPAAEVAPEVEGRSPEEIRMEAEPMSPEQAEQLGIVDTSIHVEQLVGPEDTLVTPDTLPPPGAGPR